MIILSFKLKENLVARTAINLIEELKQVDGDIFVIKSDKCFNGKSLIGLLNNKYYIGDTIQIETEERNVDKIKKIFYEVGDEL